MVILNEYKNIGGFNVKPYTSTATSNLFWNEELAYYEVSFVRFTRVQQVRMFVY